MIDCPNCSGVLEARAGRVPINHPFSKRKKTLAWKFKFGQYYYCEGCDRSFIITQMLKEVTLP